ncbi:MAG: general secretion pathway protein GspC [Labilithrix sp.]|nr:general secretion pathway protein GspC [Labilithrix sp.]
MAVDQLLRKNFWLVVLPLVAIAALLNAQAVTQLIGISLTPDEKALAAPPPVARNAPNPGGSARNPSAEPILSRNPFDHVTGSLRPPEVSADTGGGAIAIDDSDPWSAPSCDGVKVLIIAASSDPEWSFAALSGGEGKSVLRRAGGELGGKKVEFVGWDRVWFQSNGVRCQAQLFKQADLPPPPKPVASTTADPTPPGRGAPGLDPALAKGIQKLSPTEFNIDRGVVDKILENQSELMRQARIVPEQENGKVVGIRLFGVRPDTLLGVLGMENGDRLQTINGFDMASPEKALEAYARLRTADKLTVQVNRRGQAMNLDYNIK